MRLLLTALVALLLLSAAAAAQSDTEPQPGQVVHLEIPSLNLDESEKFYGDLFGWTCTRAEGDVEYLIWSDGGQTMGGFTLDTPPVDGGVMLYIFTVSIADAYAAIEAAGGSSTGIEMSVGEGQGYIGMFHDPHGNLIGLFSMQQSMPDETAAAPAADTVDPHAGHNHD